jgi:hypothetical protein
MIDTLPKHIEDGLTSGRLRYTAEQQRKMQACLNKMEIVAKDPKWSHEQQDDFARRFWGEYNSIRLNPEESPEWKHRNFMGAGI